MAGCVQPVKPIGRGYPYDVEVEVSGGMAFPAGIGLRADVRDYVGGVLAGSLSTDDGTIERIDDTKIALHLPAALTGALANNNLALIDLVRTDGAEEQWLGVRIELPVEQPVTVPA